MKTENSVTTIHKFTYFVERLWLTKRVSEREREREREREKMDTIFSKAGYIIITSTLQSASWIWLQCQTVFSVLDKLFTITVTNQVSNAGIRALATA